MKNHIRSMLPRSLVNGIGRLLGAVKRRIAPCRSPESIFSEIYRNRTWGGSGEEVCSGGGSRDPEIAGVYLEMISRHARNHAYFESTFVDLGCGDMEVGRRLIPLCRKFVGVDVVGFVIKRHRDELGDENVRFMHLDMVDDDLPDGDVCFVRQVFQHLSNRQIGKILPKLRKYRRVYVTEHVPSAGRAWIPNLDKPQGAGIRLNLGSGIDITAAPFHVPSNEVQPVLDIRGNDSGVGGDPGVIRTVLYTPGLKRSQSTGDEPMK